MAHFAEIAWVDARFGIVQQVIVAEQEFIDSGAVGDPANWIRTSYNTNGGVHRMGMEPLRKNFAGVGYTYDKLRDAFYAPKPFASWLLFEATAQWKAPKEMPNDGKMYVWDEVKRDWILAT